MAATDTRPSRFTYL